jgi:hypothetical protein
MSDAPLFQHTDEQEAELPSGSDAADDRGTDDQPVAIPGGLAPGGMGGAAAVSSTPGVIPPGPAVLPDTEDNTDAGRRSS